jgi:hypothetical protein
MTSRAVGVRWTIGDPDPRGFEALRLSIWGAWRLFGAPARYAVCVNTIPVDEARARTGPVPSAVEWRPSQDLPHFLTSYLGSGMAEGVAWKLAPPRLFPASYEISLDNDVILWDLPASMDTWLNEPDGRCLIAADVVLAHGVFTDLTGPAPRNSGIRGLPPGYDLERSLAEVLRRRSVPLGSELDEQGLQVAALDLDSEAHVVSTDDVSICSPFYPKKPELGRCGAHFVGLNVRNIPWTYFGRPATECIAATWRRHRATIHERVGADLIAVGADTVSM